MLGDVFLTEIILRANNYKREGGRVIRCVTAEQSQQLDFAPMVSSISRCTGKQTTTTTTIIHCIITSVGSYCNKDFHVPTNVIVIVIAFVGIRTLRL